MGKIILSLILASVFIMGCNSEHQTRGLNELSSEEAHGYFSLIANENWANQDQTLNVEDYSKALRVASLKLMGQDPTIEELSQVLQGKNAYERIVRSYIESPNFLNQMKKYFQGVFEMTGTSNGINYDEPTNLALHLIKTNGDFRDILRSTSCYDNNLTEIPCSAFASSAEAKDQAAGAITTRAFLQKWSAAFNFRRVAKTFKIFACKEYPDVDDPGLEMDQVSDKVKGFNCTTCQPACYSCHRNMNPRAALFYKFDVNGVFNLNPNSSEVTKTDTGAASTLADILKDGAAPVYHGKSLSKLRDYALYLSKSRHFKNCTAQRFSNFMLGTSEVNTLPGAFQSVRDRLSWNGFKIKDFVFDLVTHPEFIKRSSK